MFAQLGRANSVRTGRAIARRTALNFRAKTSGKTTRKRSGDTVEIASFAAGFAAGWLVRSTVESSREVAVELGARALGLRSLLARAVATEREFVEDLWAEIQSRAHSNAESVVEEQAPRPRPARTPTSVRPNGESHEHGRA